MHLQGAGRAVKWGGSVGSELREDGTGWDGHHTADERYNSTSAWHLRQLERPMEHKKNEETPPPYLRTKACDFTFELLLAGHTEAGKLPWCYEYMNSLFAYSASFFFSNCSMELGFLPFTRCSLITWKEARNSPDIIVSGLPVY